MKKFILILLLPCLFMGCPAGKKEIEGKVIVKIGDSVVTTEDFEAAFEITKLGYSHNYVLKNLSELKEDVLAQLIEEELILDYASKKGVEYTNEEFINDLEEVKKEYPDNVFEEILKNNSIETAVFQKRFKREMALKKALSSIINKNIEVDEKDLRSVFLKYCKANDLNSEDVKNNNEIAEIVLDTVKRLTIQADYDSLLEELKKTIEINIVKENWADVLKEGRL
ncbi:MAG: SurA N-terminal domain-containing protein [Desulforegulaceae bacterium]|nr:SurA N-terminal domain-containing protein [Desulforegulaceae bacterium]